MPTDLFRFLLVSFSKLSNPRVPSVVNVETRVTGELERLGTVSSVLVGLKCQCMWQVLGETVQRE